ncbi:MAG: CHAP domain-containing protein [Firmicutes bacterium]|nr:CHAP domain-containing protein [Bacillota bacterium]
MDIENIKERDRSGQIHINDRTVVLRRGLTAKKMTRDLKGKIRQAGKVILDQPDETEPETFATDLGERMMAREAKDKAGDVKNVGNRSVRETAKTVREHVRNRKEQKENPTKSQAGSGQRSALSAQKSKVTAESDRSVPLSQTGRTAAGQRSVPMSQRPQNAQLQMQRFSKRRLIEQKMKPLISPKRLTTGGGPITTKMGKVNQVFQKAGAALKKTFKVGKTTVTALMAAGWIGLMLIVSVSMIGALANTPLGLFFAGGVKRVSMAQVIREINYDFDNEIAAMKSMYVYDELNIRGRKSLWKDVLSIYAVQTSMNQEEPQSVAMITEENRELLKQIFWTMNSLAAEIETKMVEVDDPGSGPGSDNLDNDPIYKETTILTIEVFHLSPEIMAEAYEFDQEQMEALQEMQKPEYNEIWTMLLYGTTGGDDDILQVALLQMGNEGGEPFWSWWGYTSRVDWCAIFVSWCANECGYLEKDLFPKFQGVGTGLQWFKDRGQFRDPDMYEPMPGDIIFIDWADDGFDGLGDHVGIVEKVEGGCVWTVEGNRTDSVSQGVYGLQSEVIIGYGVVVK